jgi:hypothetical protein
MYAARKEAARARAARKARPHHSRVAFEWLGLPWPKPLGKVARFQKPIVRDGDYERVEVEVYSLHNLVCDKQAIQEMCNKRLMEGRDGAGLLRTLPLVDAPRVEHAYLHELGKEVPTHSPSMFSLPLPREAPSDVRPLPPLLDVFLTTLTRAQHILITDMLASVGTCWSKSGSGAQGVRWTGSVAAVFATLSELPAFVPVHGGGDGLLQVTLAGHELLLRDLPVYSFRVAQVLRSSKPSARIDVLVWLGTTGKEFFDFCRSVWPFLRRGVLVVTAPHANAPGVAVREEPGFVISVCGGPRACWRCDEELMSMYFDDSAAPRLCGARQATGAVASSRQTRGEPAESVRTQQVFGA